MTKAQSLVSTVTASDDELRAALRVANLPTVLAMLAHLTEDDRWLSDRYRPTRTIALNDNDSGGLTPELREEVHEAAVGVLGELRDGRREVPAPPSRERVIDILSYSLGERVPAEYAEAMVEDGGFRVPQWLDGPTVTGGRPRVLVIGAGLSGVCVGAGVRRLGLPLTIIERNDEVGGTWLENDYPGAGVDTPAHLYSFSFAPRADWSRYYPKQPEILDYAQQVARDTGVLPAIRFGTEVVSAHWDDSAHTWTVTTRASDGTVEKHVADVVISAVGLFNTPVTPRLPGLDSFPGPVFHTARWDHSVELAGRRVGVIGTGASAMQVVPSIAGLAERVTVFQRSPQWVAPNGNYLRVFDDGVRLLMREAPGYRTWYRLRLMWMMQDKLLPTLRKDPEWPHPDRSLNKANDRHRQYFVDYLTGQLAGAEHLVDALTPTYPPYGKRILMDNDWFATLRRDDVELVTGDVTGVDGTDVLAGGGRHAVDVLVLATGFSARRMLYPMDIRGRSGASLRERWGDDDADAYLGLTVPEFPNFFVMYGPNTNPGHGGSELFHAECQANYVVGMLRRMAAEDLAAVEVRPEVCADYIARVDHEHEQMIWTHPGMSTYYRNSAGRVVVTTPWRLIDYWAMTRTPDLADFHVVRRDGTGHE
jgi:4-hydroxyacetophenone monooxygenase